MRRTRKCQPLPLHLNDLQLIIALEFRCNHMFNTFSSAASRTLSRSLYVPQTAVAENGTQSWLNLV